MARYLGTGAVYRIGNLIELGLPFMFGMAAYVWRDRITLSWSWVAASLAGMLAVQLAVSALSLPHEVSALTLPLGVAVLAYATLVLAYVPQGWLLEYNRVGDYSYGTYLYAFPVQQLSVWLWPEQTWQTNVALAIIPTLLLAMLSWKFVEKPSLSCVEPLADLLRPRKPRNNQRRSPSTGA